MLEYHDVKKLNPLKEKKDKELIEAYMGSRYSSGEFKYDNLTLGQFFKWQ